MYKVPFRTWCKATTKYKSHCEKSPVHHTTTFKGANVRQVMEKRALSIGIQMDKFSSDTVCKNREKLDSIVKAIIFCGCQNIALRGHRDDAKHYKDARNNPGNLQKLLKFVASCSRNTDFEEHMESGPKSSTYRSKTVQNELIHLCGELHSLIH